MRIALGDEASVPDDYGAVRIGKDRFRLSLPHQAVCDVDLADGSVVIHPAKGIAPVALGHLIADHLLPRIAGERMYCVHAATVKIDGRAYVFAGASGAGKSTLATRLAREGAEVLGDDCAAIHEGWVYPTFRGGRVWPQSLEPLGLSGLMPDASGKVNLGRRHRVRVAGSAAPLEGVFLVGDRARRLALNEAVELVLTQRMHLGGRAERQLFDEAFDLLDRYGPIHEIDRATWLPPADRYDGE